MSKVESYVKYIENVADDDSHGYSQYNRWGPDFDCSSLIISACEASGIKVKSAGATFTGNMYSIFLKCGFKDITSTVNLKDGSGLRRGDILLNVKHHVETYIGNGKLCGAHIDEKGKIVGATKGDQTGKEICRCNYYNYPWDYVLRFPELYINEQKVGEFVERLYKECLGRESDPAGKAYWINKAKEGASGADIAYGFLRSDEFIRLSSYMSDDEYVETLYQAFLGRASDPNGKSYWLGLLDMGVKREIIIEGFIGSEEWAKLCKSYGISPL